jgi:hypothetical protein
VIQTAEELNVKGGEDFVPRNKLRLFQQIQVLKVSLRKKYYLVYDAKT